MKTCVLFLILLAILFQPSYSKEFPTHQLSIDCGATTENYYLGNFWRTDDKYIESGLNKNVSIRTTPDELNTLRYFPKGRKNCYNLPLYIHFKYLIKAGFYYGNYDGLNKAPLFDLYINGQFWTEINTNEPLFVEVIYPQKRIDLELCLVRLGNNDTPFISSIEATALPLENFYSLMDNTTFLRVQSRTLFGGYGDIGADNSYGDDHYNRVWKLKEVPGYQNVTPPFTVSYPTIENDPPYYVMEFAIAPLNVSDSITMWVDLPDGGTLPAYFVFYFNEPPQNLSINHVRKFHIYIDGNERAMVEVPQNNTALVVSLYPVNISGNANVTLAPIEGSTFPPILNAMEVFTTVHLSSGGRSYYYSSMVHVVLHVFGILILFG